MGHNRGGDNRRERLRRARREYERLAARQQAAAGVAEGPPPGQPAVKPKLGGGLLETVKEAARGTVGKVGEVIENAGKKIQGKT
jgi:hypothetical protein